MIPESEYNALLRRFYFVCGCCMALFAIDMAMFVLGAMR